MTVSRFAGFENASDWTVRFSAAHSRAILAFLITYQAIMYGWVSRAYMHLSVVVLPWLLNQPGYRLYDTINVNYAPAYLWFNAVFYRLIPDHWLRVRVGTIVIATAITLLVFIQSRRWWNTQTGLLASTLFALWGPLMLDYLFYFEFALGLLALGALMIWQRYTDSRWRPFVAGLLVGIMLLVKQPAGGVIIVFCIWRLIGRDWKPAVRDLVCFGGGVVIPLAFVVVALAIQGVLSKAMYLMIDFNRLYSTLATQMPPISDILLLAVWLGLIPYFVYLMLAKRELKHEGFVLMTGLMIALFLPVFPRYGRFHLSGTLPFVALMSAGSMNFLPSLKSSLRLPLSHLYARAIVLALVAVGAALPLYYRIKLGPATSQYDSLIPVSEWVKQETGASPGTRMWILPDIDPTSNFYPISGYEPPSFYTNTYPWFFARADLPGQVIAGLQKDPPAYVLVVDHWRSQIPEELWNYVQQHYTVSAEADFSGELGHLLLYQHIT